MFYRKFVSVLSLAAVAVLNAQVQAQSPNVIVIVADDAGYSDWGFMDGVDGSNPTPTPVPTPNLDALANRGVKFSRAYVAQSCQPTRAALVTGGYQNRIGNEVVGNNDFGLPASATTVWDRMKSQGYATGAVGKWHLGSIDGPQGNRPQTQGVDEFYGIWHGSRQYNVGNTNLPQTQLLREAIVPTSGPVTDTVVEGAHSGEFITNTFGQYGVDFIANHANGANPFFLYQSFTAPHTPLVNGPDFNDPRLAGLSGLRKQYASNMLTMDAEIGRMLDRLEDPNNDGNTSDSITDNTLIVFVNDNGGAEAGSSSPNGADNGILRAGKGTPYEGGIRVPMIVAGAGVNASVHGTTYDKAVHGVDILPTAFAAAGGTLGSGDTGIDGVNLLPHINGTNTANPHEVLVNRHRKQFTVVKGDWRLVNSGGSSTNGHQLFNIATDPSQTTNVRGANQSMAAELTRDLTAHEAVFDKQRYAILGNTEEATINTFDHFTFRPSAPAPGGTATIIQGAIGNGDFESSEPASGDQNWSATPNWYRLDGSETGNNFTTETGSGGSSQPGSRVAYNRGGAVNINDTGYTVTTAGQTFDLSLDLSRFGGGSDYNGDEQFRGFLFTSSEAVNGNTVTGDITELGNILIDNPQPNDFWKSFSETAFYTATAADVGKTLYFGFELVNPTGPAVEPRVDVIELTTVGGGSGGSSTTDWSDNGAWFEGGTNNVETMFNSDAFAGAVLEFPTTNTFSYISNNDMVRETGLEYMLNKVVLSGAFNGTQDQSATIQGNAVLFTNNLQGVGPQIAVEATNSGSSNYSYVIDLDVIIYHDLTITGDGDTTLTINGEVSNYFEPRSLTKSGTSTVVLTADNSYEGDTTIEAGTLSITNAYLEDSADVYLATGAILDLDFDGIDTIDSLYIDGISQATGTWGTIGSGATHESNLFTGSGLLSVSTLAALSGDFDNDGDVDGADFLKFQRDDGSASGLVAFQDNYGSTSVTASSGAVPEPAGLIMISIALALAILNRR
ncbi:sulfatase-like hydrolase/transferase [Adhaeretor mobilis]|nr:sulfatase-like hydrolase/transferase [Adhaeretor mobilis]